MILFGSIAAGLCVAYVAYRMLFYDASDFWDGVFFFSRSFKRGVWRPPPLLKGDNIPTAEDLFWSAVRFVLFLAVSIGTGYYVYSQLQKHFG